MAEPSGAQSGQPWRHLWDAVETDQPIHESYEGALGEYACLLLERESEQAATKLAGVALITWRSPGLIRGRTRPGPGALEGMPEELVLYGAPAAAHWPLAAIDPLSGRQWRAIPKALQAGARATGTRGRAVGAAGSTAPSEFPNSRRRHALVRRTDSV